MKVSSSAMPALVSTTETTEVGTRNAMPVSLHDAEWISFASWCTSSVPRYGGLSYGDEDHDQIRGKRSSSQDSVIEERKARLRRGLVEILAQKSACHEAKKSGRKIELAKGDHLDPAGSRFYSCGNHRTSDNYENNKPAGILVGLRHSGCMLFSAHFGGIEMGNIRFKA